MTHRQNGLLAFSWRDNALSLYQQFIQIERLFLRVAGKTYGITTSPIAAASAQWHHPQEGVEERDKQATKRALRDEQVPWVTGPAWLTTRLVPSWGQRQHHQILYLEVVSFKEGQVTDGH